MPRPCGQGAGQVREPEGRPGPPEQREEARGEQDVAGSP